MGRPLLGLAVAAISLAALIALEGLDAQQVDLPQITVAPAIVAEPASHVLLAIRVGPPEALLKKCFLSLRGLPPGVSLTEGHPVSAGSWAIPLSGLPTLAARIPPNISGRAEVTISLISMEGSLLALARTTLVVEPAAKKALQGNAPPEPPQPQSALVAPPAAVSAGSQDRKPPEVVPRPAGLSGEKTTRAERALALGEKYFANGSIIAARQFFQRAADAGLAAAALRLAATYDPVELERSQVQGVVPDRDLARRWYQRARDLGAPEAEERLAKLGTN